MLKLLSKQLKVVAFLAVFAIYLIVLCLSTLLIRLGVDMAMGVVFTDTSGVLYTCVYYAILLPLGSFLLTPYFLVFWNLIDYAKDNKLFSGE